MASEPEVFTITGARAGISQDQKGRQRTYLIGMGLRTSCFVLALIFSGPIRWFLVAGAILLPYFAVVIANAGRERGAWRGNGAYQPPQRDAITDRPADFE